MIAGIYSSFTQTAPLSFVLLKAQLYNNDVTKWVHPHYFCELGISGDRMDCFDNLNTWIRKEATIASGKLNAAKQERRMEVKFPVDYDSSSTVSISRLIK